MAVTQYIGSRYVPLFADPIEWSAQNTYEPLTIVLHEGNSYTSKQAVPKDIDISNEEFWAITGNYNAQIELYRRDTAQALSEAQEAQTSADAAQASADAAQASADSAQASADAAQGDIDTLLPKADFSAENTVKSYVDSSLQNAIESITEPATESLELVFTGVIESISKTSFTLFRMPIDTHVFQISQRAISNFDNWRDVLESYDTPILFVNGSLDGVEISDGTVLRNDTNGNYWTLFGVKNGRPAYIDQNPNLARKNATELRADGWTFCAGGFACFIDNGVKKNLSVYQGYYEYASSITAVGQRSVIGWDNDYWYILVSAGRRPHC